MSKPPSFSETLLDWLSRHDGRDKIIRMLLYGSMLVGTSDRIRILFASADNSESLKSSLLKFSSKLSETRRVLRLFDDYPMLKYTLHYGFGDKEKEPDTILRVLGVLKNVADQIYYPTDHLGWANENGIIQTGKSVPWSTISILMWAISLQLGIARAVRSVLMIREQKRIVGRSGLNEARGKNLLRLDDRELFQLLTIVQASSDLINAIHWLPASWLGRFRLWSGKLRPEQVAFFGTVSSAIGIYKTV